MPDRERFALELENAIERREQAERDLNERVHYRPGNSLSRQRLPGLQRFTEDQLRTRKAICIASEEAVRNMMERSEEQRKIMDERVDRRLLLEAMKTFGSNLKQVRLMRCEDKIEVDWHKFASTDPDLAMESKSSRWSRACEHAAHTLLETFAESGCQPPRLSGRALDPQMSLLLTNSLSLAAPVLVTHPMRLTCLELQFDDRTNLDEEMLELSELFQRGFTEAVNVQGLHIGFTRPVSIPFQSVFHDVHWKYLQHIGFGAWRLNSDDIIGFVRRHKATLTSIRLRGVLLDDGSRWLDILRVLRLEPKLKWASFRGVGYTAHERSGAMYTADDEFASDSDESEQFPGSDSDVIVSSDDDADHASNVDSQANYATAEIQSEETEAGDESYDAEQATGDNDSQQEAYSQEDWAPHSSDDDAAGSVTGSFNDNEEDFRTTINDYVPDDMEEHTDLVQLLSNSTLLPSCECGSGFGWDDLMNADDDGENPIREIWKGMPLWKWWQKWVTKHCSIHDPPASTLPQQFAVLRR